MFECFLLSFALRKNHAQAAFKSAPALRRDQGEKRGTRLGPVPLDISGSTLPPE
jgi:hypothetical protein